MPKPEKEAWDERGLYQLLQSAALDLHEYRHENTVLPRAPLSIDFGKVLLIAPRPMRSTSERRVYDLSVVSAPLGVVSGNDYVCDTKSYTAAHARQVLVYNSQPQFENCIGGY